MGGCAFGFSRLHVDRSEVIEEDQRPDCFEIVRGDGAEDFEAVAARALASLGKSGGYKKYGAKTLFELRMTPEGRPRVRSTGKHFGCEPRPRSGLKAGTKCRC
jgi:hypothetical protein